MHFETDADHWIEAKVRNKIQASGDGQGQDDKKMALDIPFFATLPVDYVLDRLKIREHNTDLKHYLHDENGDVRRFGMTEMKIDREFHDYHMAISFSPLDPDTYFERYLVETIKVTKIAPQDKHLCDIEFTVHLYPYKEKDVGKLCQEGVTKGTQCTLLQFEESQQDLDTQAGQ